MYNLKIGFIFVITAIFGIYFSSSERDLLIYEEKYFLSNYINNIGYKDHKLITYDGEKDLTYVKENIFKKDKEILFLKSILDFQDRCKLYIYGGAVRDALLNNTIRDVDAKTNCPLNIFINYLPKNINYTIVGDLIRIHEPSIDISNINSLMCNDFTLNGFIYDIRNNIIFNLYDSLDDLFHRRLLYGCDGYDPKYQLPFRLIKFKNRNYTYSKELENEIFDKFKSIYLNDHNNYLIKKNYYKNEWYNTDEDKKQFLESLSYYENLVDDKMETMDFED